MATVEGADDVGKWLEGEVVSIMNKVVDVINEDAIEASPVKSGTFKGDWRVQHTASLSNTAEVENVAPYAVYVEAKHATLSNAIETALARKL